MDVEVSVSVEDAVKDASIVTLVTRAVEPFLSSFMLSAGCHINAVGALTPERQEFTQDIFDRCDLIAVDTLDSVRRLSSEFIQQFDTNDWSSVTPLSSLVASKSNRPTDADLTLFKAMGMGLSDLAMGTEILNRAVASGVGRVVPQPEKKPLRLF